MSFSYLFSRPLSFARKKRRTCLFVILFFKLINVISLYLRIIIHVCLIGKSFFNFSREKNCIKIVLRLSVSNLFNKKLGKQLLNGALTMHFNRYRRRHWLADIVVGGLTIEHRMKVRS